MSRARKQTRVESQHGMKMYVSCREKELDVDEEYDVDGGLDMYESRKKKGTKVFQYPFCHLYCVALSGSRA